MGRVASRRGVARFGVAVVAVVATVLLSSAAGGAAGGPDEPSGLGGAVIKGTVPPSSTSPVGAGVTSSDGLPLPATPLLDDFNRSDGPLGSNWAQVSTAGTLGIQSGIVKVTSGGHGEYYWTPASFGPDVEAYVDSGGLSCCQTQDTVRLLLRVQQVAPAAFSGYELISYFGIGGNGWWLRKYANGSYTDLASRGTDVWEHMLFRAVGDTLQGWASHDGVNWTLLLQATDSTY